MKNIFSLIRVKHWVKNLLIFLPAFFGGEILSSETTLLLLIIFLYFSLSASFVYVINDLIDLKKDKLHPQKKNRVLASEKISIRFAFFLLIGLFTIISIISFKLPFEVVIITGIYILINVFYSFLLKKIPILELFIISLGFVLRILIGGYGSDVEPSKWIIMLTFFISLYIILSKRRGELLNKKAKNSREVLKEYTVEYLTIAMVIMVTISIVSYMMYTLEPLVIDRFSTDKIYITSFIIMFILLRHLQQTIVFNKTESPVEYFFRDKMNFIAVLILIFTFFTLIYFS